MTIFLPDNLKSSVDSQVADHSYTGRYLPELIRKDQARTQLRALLLDGAASLLGSEVTDAYIDNLKKRLRARADRTA